MINEMNSIIIVVRKLLKQFFELHSKIRIEKISPEFYRAIDSPFIISRELSKFMTKHDTLIYELIGSNIIKTYSTQFKTIYKFDKLINISNGKDFINFNISSYGYNSNNNILNLEYNVKGEITDDENKISKSTKLISYEYNNHYIFTDINLSLYITIYFDPTIATYEHLIKEDKHKYNEELFNIAIDTNKLFKFEQNNNSDNKYELFCKKNISMYKHEFNTRLVFERRDDIFKLIIDHNIGSLNNIKLRVNYQYDSYKENFAQNTYVQLFQKNPTVQIIPAPYTSVNEINEDDNLSLYDTTILSISKIQEKDYNSQKKYRLTDKDVKNIAKTIAQMIPREFSYISSYNILPNNKFNITVIDFTDIDDLNILLKFTTKLFSVDISLSVLS